MIDRKTPHGTVNLNTIGYERRIISVRQNRIG